MVWLLAAIAEAAVAQHWTASDAPMEAVRHARGWCTGEVDREACLRVSDETWARAGRGLPREAALAAYEALRPILAWSHGAGRHTVAEQVERHAFAAGVDRRAQAKILSALLLDPDWPPWDE